MKKTYKNCLIFTLSRKFYFVLMPIFAVTIVNCSTDETQTVTTFNKLVLEENFNTDGPLDSNFWNFDIGNGAEQGIPGWGNNESQFYTDRPENVIIENGVLKLIARQEQFQGFSYTSGRIQTKGKYQKKFGRIEARIKLPWGQGLWPAFWMLGDDKNGTEVWPQIGEIDIMENRGQQPTKVIGSVHGPGYSGGNAVSKEFDLMNDRFDTGFHIFGIEWGENFINYYVDDVLYNQITPRDVSGEWVFNDEFYILLNVAVGGNFVGPPSSQTVFPQVMEIDYIKVFEK